VRWLRAGLAAAALAGCHGSSSNGSQESAKGTPMTTPSPELAALATSLQQDAARDVPPFGAASVQQARALGAKASPLLVERVRGRGGEALLALEALRGADPAGYAALPAAERAAVYASALQHSTYFNAWGQPGGELTETAHAFAALGDAAVAVLAPLLDDPRPAPSSGSQDATLSQRNGNRVCDYAWVLISEARHARYAYLTAPGERDQDIAALRAQLRAP
jgi:hypothetical protein